MNTVATETENRTYPFLRGGGEMGALTRNFDWSKTAVGSPDTWPHYLRTTVSNLLRSKFPMFLWWGEDMIQFYNDAYRPSMGNEGKHPTALGQKGKECWPEIWDIISPLHHQVKTTGEATWMEDQLVPIYRNGRLEDVYWTYSYSSVLDDAGEHAGILVTCTETTGKVQAQQNLVEREKTLRNTILQAPVAICIFRGPEFIIEVANHRMFEFWGKSSEQVMHKPIFEAVPEAKNQGYEELMDNVLNTGQPYTATELTVTLPRNGVLQTVYFNLSYDPVREADGSISGIMAMAMDITEQVEARRRVEESVQEVRSLVESAPFPIGVYIGREMRIKLVNKSIIEVWGKGPEVVGKTYAEVLPELKDKGIYEQLDRVYTTGQPFHARNQRVDLVVDGILQSFYFNYSFTPLYDSEGKTYGVMNTAAEITDLHLAKQQVEQSERNFRSMILQAPVAMCILLGPEHVIDIANDAMIEIWGKPVASVMQKPVFEALPDARNQGLEQVMQEVYKTGIPFYANERPVQLLRNGNWDTVYQNFVYQPYLDADGNILGVLAISVDVTSQVQARQKIEEVVVQRTSELAQANHSLVRSNEELSRLNANLEDFTYAASHDLKEPIRKIHFFSDRLKTALVEKLTEEQKHLFDRMEHASRRMGTLVDDLLNYSHASRGIAEIESVDLHKKVQLVLEDLELEVQQKKADITVDSLPVIRGNRRQLQQLFHNLLTNALKYSKPGTPPQVHISSKNIQGSEVDLALSAEEANRVFHLITVKDNGIGFNQQDAERIFNVFTRLHGNNEYRGTGVGLSIVRKVVENHHGYIWAQSSPGQGASFMVLLPAE